MTQLDSCVTPRGVVLSLFPGIDLLGRAFSAVGFCVVTGPDVLLGQRIEEFHGRPGVFEGVIGGPPCVNYSTANPRRDRAEGDRLVTEFLRVVGECAPVWWLLENVPGVPTIKSIRYCVQRLDVTDLETGGRSRRRRHFQFGHIGGHMIRPVRSLRRTAAPTQAALTCRGGGRGESHAERCRRMGFDEIELPALTGEARRAAVGNGVPFGMGRAVARAVTLAAPRRDGDCDCGCGRECPPGRSHAGDACRQRCSRKNRGRGRSLDFPGEG